MVSIVASTSKSANSRAMWPSKRAPRSEFEFAADMDLSPFGAFWIFIRCSSRIAFPALLMSDLSFSNLATCSLGMRSSDPSQVRETLYVGLPHIRPEYQMHKLALPYDFDQSTIVQFVCMMRECSRANL